MYHGVRHDRPTGRSTGSAWRCWTSRIRALLLHRTDEWVFGPEAPYEITGDVGRGRLPMRLGPRSGERPTAPLLRRRGLGHRPGDGHVQRGHRAGLRLAADPLAARWRGASSVVDVDGCICDRRCGRKPRRCDHARRQGTRPIAIVAGSARPARPCDTARPPESPLPALRERPSTGVRHLLRSRSGGDCARSVGGGTCRLGGV